jgi:hypothetical protein
MFLLNDIITNKIFFLFLIIFIKLVIQSVIINRIFSVSYYIEIFLLKYLIAIIIGNYYQNILLLFDGFLIVILISERSSSWKMSGEGSRLGLEFPQEGGCNASKRCGEILIAFYL